MNANILEAIAVTAELTQSPFTPAAARVLATDLEPYPEDQVLKALDRARKEVRPGQLTVEAIVSRLPDGRPGPEEAWAALPTSDQQTVVWTEETNIAWARCRRLLDAGEHVQARMAFKEVYVELVKDARRAATPVKWVVSLGHNLEGRRTVLLEAARKGRLQREEVLALLPGIDFETGADGKVTALLALPNIPPKAREALTKVLATAKARRAQRNAERDHLASDLRERTYEDPEWCKAHGVRYDERA